MAAQEHRICSMQRIFARVAAKQIGDIRRHDYFNTEQTQAFKRDYGATKNSHKDIRHTCQLHDLPAASVQWKHDTSRPYLDRFCVQSNKAELRPSLLEQQLLRRI